MDRLIESALFVVGLVFGSFLNVCISRIPRDESITTPRSHCPHCGAPIRWYDNIPVLSWLILSRRCRNCGRPISARYPTVELLTAALFTACYVAYGPTWLAIKLCIFSFLLVGLIFMDAETGLLPREFTYSGIVIGLGLSWLATTDPAGTSFLLRLFNLDTPRPHFLSLVDASAGAAIGAGFFYLVWAVYYLVRKRHGLGFGDIALMGMSGAFLGLKMVVLVTFLAPLLTVVYIAFLLLREAMRPASKQTPADNQPFLSREIPFGVFLGTCALLVSFTGETIWRWYLNSL